MQIRIKGLSKFRVFLRVKIDRHLFFSRIIREKRNQGLLTDKRLSVKA